MCRRPSPRDCRAAGPLANLEVAAPSAPGPATRSCRTIAKPRLANRQPQLVVGPNREEDPGSAQLGAPHTAFSYPKGNGNQKGIRQAYQVLEWFPSVEVSTSNSWSRPSAALSSNSLASQSAGIIVNKLGGGRPSPASKTAHLTKTQLGVTTSKDGCF